MIETLLDEEIAIVDHENCHIVVTNDDHNPFDKVIEAFIQILGHTPEQAEQLAYMIHTKGSARVKHGTFEELREPCEALIGANLDSTIE